jgi:hypothetical protein
VGAAIFQHLKGLVVVVAARFTFSHLSHSHLVRTKCQELLEELTRDTRRRRLLENSTSRRAFQGIVIRSRRVLTACGTKAV